MKKGAFFFLSVGMPFRAMLFVSLQCAIKYIFQFFWLFVSMQFSRKETLFLLNLFGSDEDQFIHNSIHLSAHFVIISHW